MSNNTAKHYGIGKACTSQTHANMSENKRQTSKRHALNHSQKLILETIVPVFNEHVDDGQHCPNTSSSQIQRISSNHTHGIVVEAATIIRNASSIHVCV